MQHTTTTHMATIQNGFITIASPKGGHRTFRVRTRSFPDGRRNRVIGLLTGPGNEEDYEDFGFVDEAGARINVWKRMRGASRATPSTWEKLAEMVIGLVVDPGGIGVELVRAGYTVDESRRCRRCNRRLTTPESIEIGLGPECAGRE